jgi:hypothetical protein
LSLVSALLLGLIVIVVLTAWSVRHFSLGGNRLNGPLQRALLTAASLPPLIGEFGDELRARIVGRPIGLLLDVQDDDHAVSQGFPAPSDDGYLLFSGLVPGTQRAQIELIRIRDGAVLARWKPDWPGILSGVSDKGWWPRPSQYRAMAVHPLLTADGDVVFNVGSALVRLSSCTPTPVWILDEPMHHSNEADGVGGSWTPSLSNEGLSDLPWLQARVRDDALAQVTGDGRLTRRISVMRILRENDQRALVFAAFGGHVNDDPMHVNQISVAPYATRYWDKGDLLVSVRNLSLVFLYRPSTGRIIWQQMGPWLNQHDAEFVDNHRISVFDNHVVAVGSQHFMAPGDINRVFVYDFDTDALLQPWAPLLAVARPRTVTEGRARVLPDGGLFIEETNSGRFLRFGRDGLLWSFVNEQEDGRRGAVAWSRYLTPAEADGPLEALRLRNCGS